MYILYTEAEQQGQVGDLGNHSYFQCWVLWLQRRSPASPFKLVVSKAETKAPTHLAWPTGQDRLFTVVHFMNDPHWPATPFWSFATCKTEIVQLWVTFKLIKGVSASTGKEVALEHQGWTSCEFWEQVEGLLATWILLFSLLNKGRRGGVICTSFDCCCDCSECGMLAWRALWS